MTLAQKIIALMRSGLNRQAAAATLGIDDDTAQAHLANPGLSDPPSGGGGGGAIVKRALAERSFTAPFVDTSGAMPAGAAFPPSTLVLSIPITVTDDFSIVEVFSLIEYGPHSDNLETSVVIDDYTWMDYTESTWNNTDPARVAGGWDAVTNIQNSGGTTRANVQADMGVNTIGYPIGGPIQDPWLTLLMGAGDHVIGLGLRTPGAPPRSDQTVQVRNAVLAVRVVG